jgi:RNA polymerase sigma-54 factor
MLRQDTTQQQTQVQRIGPHLIHANALLQCTNSELLQMIDAEQQVNPALDGAESLGSSGDCPYCPNGGNPPCATCPFNRSAHPLEDAQDRAPEEDYRFMMGGSDDQTDDSDLPPNHLSMHSDTADISAASTSSDYDPVTFAAATVSLAEQLLSHLKATSSSAADAQIAEYLVDSLDEQGYLRLNMDEACAVLQATVADIETGIERLQLCEPPGIGARNLRECLLLQMMHLKETGDDSAFDKVAEAMVRHQWDLFVQRRYPQIARRLGVSLDRVEQAVAFVQNQLTPHPASQFRQPFIHRPDSQSDSIRPDVVIIRTATGFKVELAGLDNLSLQISPHYRGLYDAIRAHRSRTAPAPGMTRELQKHVVDYVERADLFLKNIQRRQWTIQRIATALVEQQQGFLETGRRAFIRPLTRTHLAQQLGMHESTISRALLHKFVQLPSQEVVSFDVFFGSGSGAKDAVAELVASENPQTPLSDQAIMKALNDRGIAVARRTVVKYREELRIPASYLRRHR